VCQLSIYNSFPVIRTTIEKNRHFYVPRPSFFVCPGDAPSAVTLNVGWMKRQFSACQTPRSIYISTLNSFPVIRTASAKNRRFHVPQPTFLFLLETSLRISRNVLHGWKDNSMLAKRLTACTYLYSIVSELGYTMLKSMRKSKNRYFYHIFVSLGTPLGNHAKCCMDGKIIRCLQIVSLHVPI